MAEGQDARVQEIRNVIHACVAEGGAWLLDGGDAVTLLARLDALTAERDECQRMLEDLTPGGSEFYRNPIRCRNWVQDRLSSAHASTVKAVQERDALAARLAAAEAALAASKALIQSDLDMADERREVLAGIRAALAGSRERAAEGEGA